MKIVTISHSLWEMHINTYQCLWICDIVFHFLGEFLIVSMFSFSEDFVFFYYPFKFPKVMISNCKRKINKSKFCKYFVHYSCRPNVLDNFALISGQVNTVLKILRNEKTPLLRNKVLLPLVLSPEKDEELFVSILHF